MGFDTALFHDVIRLRQPWLDDVMVLASALAGGGFVWIVLALIVSVLPRYRADAWRLLLAVGFSFLLTDVVLKPWLERPRPFDADPTVSVIVGRPVTSSMPSGHTTQAVAAAVAGARLLPGLGWALWPFAGVVALSRIYVGVHWPTDVVAGAIIGLACGWLVVGGRLPARPYLDR